MESIPAIDDFLGPLHQGVWEVVILKETVTEPPGPGWQRSTLNIPSPGTLASYRKGQYHVHETATEWRVHLDHHDPVTHPFLHLADDAPLLLMIGDTFLTLATGTRKRTGDGEKILEGQERAWHEQVLAGLLLGLVGIFIIFNPLLTFSSITLFFIPLAICSLGGYIAWKGPEKSSLSRRSYDSLVRGIGIVCVGIVAFLLPLQVWVVGTLGILAVWMVASAVVLLSRAGKGRAAIPEGFFGRIAIALASLLLAGLIVLIPRGILQIFVVILGALAVLLGLMLAVNGIRLRRRMKSPCIVE